MMYGSLKNTRYMQYVAALAASFSISCGFTYVSWPSPSLGPLTSDDSPIGYTLSSKESSWIASVYLLGGVPAGPIAAITAESIGRKRSLILAALLMLFPWLLIIFAVNFWMLLVARFIGGIGYLTAVTTCAIYIGEIADNDIRGKLSTIFSLLKLAGTITVLSAGPYVSYTTLAIICMCFPAVFIIMFIFMPESPYYLVRKNRMDEARRVVRLLSAESLNADRKLNEIRRTVDHDMKNKMSLREFLTKTDYRKVIYLMAGIKTFQMLNGAAAIESYMQQIIGATNSSISEEVSSIICGCVKFVGVFLAMILIERMGRKPIWILASAGCAIGLMAEGVYFYLQDNNVHKTDGIGWLPTAMMMLYLISDNFGTSTIPYVLLGEVFATNIKSIAVSVATVYGSVLSFLVAKLFETMSDSWGMYTTFWIYAGCCILGIGFVSIALPETKGRSFLEIQDRINNRKPLLYDGNKS